MRRNRMNLAKLAATGALVAALAGCGIDRDSWNPEVDHGTPGAVHATYAHVSYYPACGNEVLTFQDTSWYPVDLSQDSDFVPPTQTGEASALDAPALGDAKVAADPVGAVVAPGPGDDMGTLTVFENGYAYWSSDSGKLARWLTDKEQQYNFVC